jgi:GntR family transcriptional regulator, transcriptional repressor for pyruvate dehydrogenase complex
LRSEAEFQPLARTTFAADAIRTIKEMILDGRLQPGQRLPSERALSEALGVSRPTVREAIRSLQAMNILESRHGSGTFVSSLSTEELLAPFQFAVALSDSALEHLFEVRLLLEPQAAALAAQRGDDDQFTRLRDCARRSRSRGLTPDDRVRLDIELHAWIARAAANPLLEHLLASMGVMAQESRSYTVRLPGVARKSIDEHQVIVDAICARDAERARDAMAAHLGRLRDAALSDRGGRTLHP